MDNFRRYGIIIAILVIIGCGGVAFWTIFHDSGTVAAPQLVGMSCNEAADTLEKLGLSAKIQKVDSMEAADTVVSQNVEPGTKLNSGDSLVLEISRGGKLADVPDVRGLKQAEAVRRIEENGFRVAKTINVNDENHIPGTVLAQNPSSGQKINEGCAVELLVCGGEVEESGGMVNVPDLRGKTAEQAEAELQKEGLSVGDKVDVESASKEGTVVSTKPSIGSRVETGTAVELRIAQASVQKGEISKPKEEHAEETKKENVVRAVKAEQVKQRQTAVKTAKTKTDTKSEAKKEVKKSDLSAKAKETKKTEIKTAEKKAEAKAKTDVKKDTKKATDNVKTTETKQATKKETKTEAKKADVEASKKSAETKTAKSSAEQKTETKTEAEQKTQAATKSAKVRYIVPPLTRPMSLKITMRDAQGTHVLKDITAQGNEVINVPIKYAEKATVTILLGGESVCQENYK